MIRFLDKEVYSIEKNDINRSGLFSYFCQKEHNDDIILVYNQGMYQGYINYQTLLSTASSGTDSFIVTEKYIHKEDDAKIWENLHALLKNLKESGLTRDAFIPIFNEQNQLLYFAYEYVKEQKTLYVDVALEELQVKRPEIFLQDVYPQITSVCINDCNEWAYIFSDILENYDFPYTCIGEKWETLFPKKVKKLKDAEFGRLKLYAEGTTYFPQYNTGDFLWNWDFLVELRQINHFYLSEKIKENLKEKKIKALTMYFPYESKSKTMEEEIRRLHGILPTQEVSWERAIDREQIEKIIGKDMSWQRWKVAQKDRERNQKQLRVRGKILEKKSFGKGSNCIYIIGPCITHGTCVTKDEESIGYILGEKLETKNYSIQCIMYPLHNCLIYEDIIHSLTLTENDVVILIDRFTKENFLQYQSDLPISELIQKREGDWFWDCPIHATAKGCSEIAHAMLDWISPLLENPCKQPKYLQVGIPQLNEMESEKLETYIKDVKACCKIKEGSSIGAIVMNCNPMTKGHLHLIDYARQRVDYLYIFVVREDKSVFPFQERFAMVKKETEQFENVIVVSSGEFVLSYTTMPLYFEKEEKKEEILDATNDLAIFGEYVAKGLGITKRFVGEEPSDLITRQYNEAMKKILPNYGVAVEEIKRFEVDKEVVSASKIRKWMKEGEWEQIEKFVPATVYERLHCR